MKYKITRPFNHDRLGKFERGEEVTIPKHEVAGLLKLGYIEPVRRKKKEKVEETE